MIASTVSTFAGLIIGLIVLFIAILAVLTPVFIWLIWKQGVRTQRTLEGYTIGINSMLVYMHNIQQNTKPKPVMEVEFPEIDLD